MLPTALCGIAWTHSSTGMTASPEGTMLVAREGVFQGLRPGGGFTRFSAILYWSLSKMPTAGSSDDRKAGWRLAKTTEDILALQPVPRRRSPRPARCLPVHPATVGASSTHSSPHDPTHGCIESHTTSSGAEPSGIKWCRRPSPSIKVPRRISCAAIFFSGEHEHVGFRAGPGVW
jgi:hypothetical protein